MTRAGSGGKQDKFRGFSQDAGGRTVMTWVLGARSQQPWGCLALTGVEGLKLAWRGDGHARAARREGEWYRF